MRRVIRDTEHRCQVAIMQWAEMARAEHPELENLTAHEAGGYRHITTAQRHKAAGVRPGFPDMFLYAPSSRYAGLAIELKRPALPGRSRRGVVSPLQEAWHQRLRAYGYAVAVAYGSDEAIEAIRGYLAGEVIE